MQPGFPRGQAGNMVLAGRRRTIAFFIALGARLRCAIFLTPTAAGQRRRPGVVDRDQALGFQVAEGHMGGPETGRQKLCQPCNIWQASTQAPSSSHSGSRYRHKRADQLLLLPTLQVLRFLVRMEANLRAHPVCSTLWASICGGPGATPRTPRLRLLRHRFVSRRFCD